MKTEREKKLLTKHWLYGGTGAMLVGSGLAVLLKGSSMRGAGQDPWFWVSTGGFALIFAGVSFIGDSNRFKIMVDVLRELDGRQKPGMQ